MDEHIYRIFLIYSFTQEYNANKVNIRIPGKCFLSFFIPEYCQRTSYTLYTCGLVLIGIDKSIEYIQE